MYIGVSTTWLVSPAFAMILFYKLQSAPRLLYIAIILYTQ